MIKYVTKRQCGIFITVVLICFFAYRRNIESKKSSPFKYYIENSEIQDLIDKLLISNNDASVAFYYDNSSSSLPLSSRIKAKKLFTGKPLVVWATEWHMTPIKDFMDVVQGFGVKVIDYNLDPWRCEWHDCNAKKKLKVLTSDNVLNVEGTIPEDFVAAYRNSEEMAAVDVVYCGYPVGVCELYEPLNKSILVVATTRYDVGRYTVKRWNKLNEALIRFSTKSQNIIGGNSLYDSEYIAYYTGIKTRHLQSMCDYTGASYTNSVPTFLVLRRRDNGFNKKFFDEYNVACKAINCKVKLELMGGFSYQQLSSYRGIVHVPYQISVMSIFEQYRMNMPMFFPTVRLLAEWQRKSFIMPERTFDGAWMNKRPNGSIIPPHSSHKGKPDPKDEFSEEALLYWLKFSDFYQIMPHSFYFDSVTDLVRQLHDATDEQLWQVSEKMKLHNMKVKMQLLTEWRQILINYADASPNKPPHL